MTITAARAGECGLRKDIGQPTVRPGILGGTVSPPGVFPAPDTIS